MRVADNHAMPRKARIQKELRSPTFIKAWRKHRGLTLEGLVESLSHRLHYEISDGQLSRVERGLSPYSQDLLEAIAIVLDTKATHLIHLAPETEETARELFEGMTEEEQREAAAILRALNATRHRTGTGG